MRALGFDGPYSGSRHQFMLLDNHRLAVPSNAEYSVAQLRMMIREVEAILGRPVSPDEWSGM
ncbi:MAG: type II toxin-antitoxin system HicA family toxin [Gammaproteobacteria bacterium]|nr:type II toxin-antitoxin system HicA family toxin [Gammaproteobacteria bacterium]